MINLYNSLTRKIENFVPDKKLENYHGEKLPYQVKLYVCGPTVYDFAHLGNARAIVVFDVLFRLLKNKFAEIIYVRNVTDVDDKIYQKSIKEKCHFSEIAKKYINEFHEDMKNLNNLEPTFEPKATEYISKMIEIIQKLIELNFAYESNGHVLFHVKQCKNYGELSKKSTEELIAGSRVEIAEYKKSPFDFVLWKPSTNQMPGWESPWGFGRPGWHIECSAMSLNFFGDSFDIHGGGIDLIFPHHENELAQSSSFTGKNSICKIWMHNGHLMVNGKKMSKSLNNFLTIRDLTKKYPPEAIRFALIMTHYRQPFDWNDEVINSAQNILMKWYKIFREFDEFFNKKEDINNLINFNKYILESDFLKNDLNENMFDNFFKNESEKIYAKELINEIKNLNKSFDLAICEDLNTPLAISILHKFFNLLSEKKIKLFEEKEWLIKFTIIERIKNKVKVLGILDNSKSWFNFFEKEFKLEKLISDEEIFDLIEKRKVARLQKNFKLSDEIRDFLLSKGVKIFDNKDETSWEIF